MTLTRRTILAAAPGLLLAKKTAKPRMNVLFVGSDDLNNSLGCYGHPIVKSPNIDALAARGVRFDRAYCQFPLCGPSRTSMLSGLRPESTRIHANSIGIREKRPDVVTLPQLFRQNGYLSARHGKMYHMNVPFGVGTSDFDDPQSWDVAVSPKGAEDKTEGEGRNITPHVSSGGAMHWINFKGDGSDQADHNAAELTVQYIDRNKDKPWFIGLGFVRPHVPLVAPARFFDLYPLNQMKPVENPPGDRDDIPAASEKIVDLRGGDMKMNDHDKRESLRAYYASISYMDSLLGRVLTHLDRLKLREQTAVVFWGDHGWHLGEHFRWQKRSLFEESARVPMIVSAPGRRGNGKASRGLVEMVDLFPTVAQLAGLTAPSHLEGQSMVPLLDSPGLAWKRAAFTEMRQQDIVGRSVRTDNYRYTRWDGPLPGEELYDERNDPREFRNLASDQTHEKLLAQMRGVLDAGWRAARAGG